eukprot:m.301738 g.301738  ORF g.301738 m.301738 type:complete len:655 (-) comp14900_c0_seq1:60-2024(-)
MAAHYLKVAPRVVRMPPVSPTTSVFFEETNRQVFIRREGDTVVRVLSVESAQLNTTIEFPTSGVILSMKLSPDNQVLAVQRTKKKIEFVNLRSDSRAIYSQTCKKRDTQLLGFHWVFENEIVFITSSGLELYSVNVARHSLKHVKSYNVPCNWFVYSHTDNLLLLSSISNANTLHPFLFKKGGAIMRLTKFTVDMPMYNQQPQVLLERDVVVARIYGRLCLLFIKNGSPAEVAVCALKRDSGIVKTDSLVLGMAGRFAINIIDNLIVVHHQLSKMSMIFDLKWNKEPLPGDLAGANIVRAHDPVTSPLPIAPIFLNDEEGNPRECEAYTATWIVFAPDILIDANLGALWTLTLDLEPLTHMLENKALLVDFLLRRRDGRQLILSSICEGLMPQTQCSLPTLSKIFDHIHRVAATCFEAQPSLRDAAKAVTLDNPATADRLCHRHYLVITQAEMCIKVFSSVQDEEATGVSFKFMFAVLVEYIRSLNQYGIDVEPSSYIMVIELLARNKRYYQLHQFLQYHVVTDSKPVACTLLALESKYPPTFQLALDMLKRTAVSSEEILEGLLSKNMLLPAMRFLRSLGPTAVATVSPRRFLEAAYCTKDPVIFHTAFKFFQKRNFELRKDSKFAEGELCEVYVQRFCELFGEEALELDSTC